MRTVIDVRLAGPAAEEHTAEPTAGALLLVAYLRCGRRSRGVIRQEVEEAVGLFPRREGGARRGHDGLVEVDQDLQRVEQRFPGVLVNPRRKVVSAIQWLPHEHGLYSPACIGEQNTLNKRLTSSISKSSVRSSHTMEMVDVRPRVT
jgi:hypothetical protein